MEQSEKGEIIKRFFLYQGDSWETTVFDLNLAKPETALDWVRRNYDPKF